jgi:methyl-accepting chemotaxis protein
MKLPDWLAFRTIRSRLAASLGLLVAGVVTSAALGIVALRLMTGDIGRQLDNLRESAEISAALQSSVLAEIAAAEGYLASPSAELAERFQTVGLETHGFRRRYRGLAGLAAEDRLLVDSLARLQAGLEVQYALAHAELDVGRADAARGMAARARGPANSMTQLIRVLSSRETERAAAAAADLARSAQSRQGWLLFVLGLSTVAGLALAFVTLRAVETPLARLVRSAERLGQGDLRLVEHGQMATEFAALADAFRAMNERLRGIVSEVVGEAERIASSAGDLSAISQQLAASSGQISTSMMEISTGAEQQAARLAEAGAAAGEMRAGAAENAAASSRVAALGGEIRTVAARHRQDVQGALGALLEVRGVVRDSAAEVASLARSSEAIDEFVALVKRIASQTNLLALNAAIEAARAGEHGRGFAVVAEEVRKLADESAAAAEQVTETLQHIRRQVDQVTATMSSGVERVQGVEQVSQAAALGLEAIVAAVSGVEEAARRVASAASNVEAASQEIERVSSSVTAQAQKHAASAESVTAATEEQSASTEEMAAAASEMLSAAERLRKTVSGFRL